jgi:cytochrome c-type biogenesis protein CcmF
MGKSTVDISFYNTMNLPLVIVMVLFIGFSLYTQWGMDDWKQVGMRALRWMSVSLLACVGLYFVGVRETGVLMLILTSLFAMLVNFEFGWKQGTKDLRAIGGKLAHIGLAVFLLGVIASGKYNTTKQTTLPLNQPVEALGHTLTYTGYAPTPDDKYAFHVNVEKNGAPFTLSPVMFDGGQQGMMRNPDIKSFLTSDFYISPISLEQPEPNTGDHGNTYTIEKGKTITLGQYKATFVKFDMNSHSQDAMTGGGAGDMAVGSVLEVTDGKTKETVTPMMMYSVDGRPTYKPSQSQLMNATVQLVSMNIGGMGPDPSSVTIDVRHAGEGRQSVDALIVEASIKPFIGLVWAGTLVMFVGFFVAMMKRLQEA